MTTNRDAKKDSREKLLYDASELVADCAPSGGDCDPMYRAIVELLDRQAAITANETSHDNPYVGLVRGKQWERTEISDYYCGRCGWKVTDHDSYCPECGGALHKASNKPDSKFDARKTAETPETDAAKGDIRDFDDSREKLEADVFNHIAISITPNKPDDGVLAPVGTVFGWFDRVAAITERELRGKVLTLRKQNEEHLRLIDSLTTERDELAEKVVQFRELNARVAELEAERDALVVVDWWRDEHGDMHAVAANGDEVCHYVRGEHAKMVNKALADRDALIRDMARELRSLNDGGISTDCMEYERRMRELGIEV